MPPKTPKDTSSAPYQSRDASAYDGAKLKPWGKTRADSVTGAVAPKSPEPTFTFQGAGPLADNTFTGSPWEGQQGAAGGYVDKAQADLTWAETQGGPIAGVGFPSEKTKAGYSANVPVWNEAGDKETTQKAPLFLRDGKPDEVEKLVSMGVISRTTADKIYSKRNETEPMQKLRAKTPVAPGMDYAPSASSLPPETFAAPLPAGKPLTSPVLPAAPKPEDDYAAAIQWSRGKWGL